MIKRWVYVTTQFEGTHRYPSAPEEVSFLRHIHRHIFWVTVWIEVEHNDRDIEFILFKRYIDKQLTKSDYQSASCETIAEQLIDVIKIKYPEREIVVKVSEDNENGAVVEYKN